MSRIKISPAKTYGALNAVISKSILHRAVICASLCRGVTDISPVVLSQDIEATISCARALGAGITVRDGIITATGSDMFSVNDSELFCNESGSTLRFMIPVAAAGGVNTVFTGSGRLPDRPLGVYQDILPEHGVNMQTKGGLPLKISGRLKSGSFSIPGNISSQFISGLLMALPLLEGDSTVTVTGVFESKAYVDMTVDVLKKFGVFITEQRATYCIKGGNSFASPDTFITEGDWSQAAFLLVLGALSGEVTLNGLSPDSLQGDKECVNILKSMGADISFKDGNVISRPSALKGTDIDASQIPDLVPALAVAASVAEGRTVISGAARLRIKESDRLSAVAHGITALGGDVAETADGLVINGVKRLRGGFVNGFNDHRIVMAFTVASACCDSDIIISDCHSINKSYPGFFNDFKSLGGIADELDMG